VKNSPQFPVRDGREDRDFLQNNSVVIDGVLNSGEAEFEMQISNAMSNIELRPLF
jgi:hypothetical protein